MYIYIYIYIYMYIHAYSRCEWAGRGRVLKACVLSSLPHPVSDAPKGNGIGATGS